MNAPSTIAPNSGSLFDSLHPADVAGHTASVPPRGRILVVDDERPIREVVQYALEREGFAVTLAASGEQADAALERESFCLMVLDIMLPDADGLELCRRYRQKAETPILFLSARGEEIDRVLGLEMGADDYLTKPFGTRELVARVKAVLRRAQPSLAPEPRGSLRLEVGKLQLDVDRHELTVSGNSVTLTHTEFCLLQSLMRRPGVVFSRAQLMQLAYSDETHITERTVDTHVRRIRAKLREQGVKPIVTVHGVGYKLTSPPGADGEHRE